MGLYDHIKLDHGLFGRDKGHVGQTKAFEFPFMETYEITPEGRLVKEEVDYEDHSDPTAKPGGLESIIGVMTPVPTGKKIDTNYHGFLDVWGAEHIWTCKFTDGVLVDAYPRTI